MEKLKEKFIKQFGVTFTGEDDWIPPFQVWEFIEQNCQPKQVKVEPEVINFLAKEDGNEKTY